MTEDRARPLAAFALVSLLCAIILGVNLAQGGHTVLVPTRSAHTQLSSSAVVFGDTLAPRAAATQAAGSVSAGLAGVGPLSDAVARTSDSPARGAAKHADSRGSTHGKKSSTSHAQPSHGSVKAATTGRSKKGHAASTHTVRSHSGKSRGHHVKANGHVKGHIRHGWGKSHGSHGHHFGYGRGHGHHFGYGHGHHRGYGHH